MNPPTIMLVAGDPSGDALAADLMRELEIALPDPVHFIGAGGPKMAEAGARLEFDLTRDAVIGLSDALKKYWVFRRHLHALVKLAAKHRPELIVLVDFSGFNRRLAHAIRQRQTSDWRPKIVQYVSPQVWASRPGRADKMARDYDLLLCLFPFEKPWYARRAPKLRVEFVGHPIFDRFGPVIPCPVGVSDAIALLPGSRRAELTRHLPVMFGAAARIHAERPSRFQMVLPTQEMAELARSLIPAAPPIEIVIGDLAPVLRNASLAIAKTGTVTLECAYFGVPTVALYKTSWITHFVGRRIVSVKYLSMPNLLANEPVFPEFVQDDATSLNIAESALLLLNNDDRRWRIQARLGEIIAELGGSGASQRAARILADLPKSEPSNPT